MQLNAAQREGRRRAVDAHDRRHALAFEERASECSELGGLAEQWHKRGVSAADRAILGSRCARTHLAARALPRAYRHGQLSISQSVHVAARRADNDLLDARGSFVCGQAAQQGARELAVTDLHDREADASGGGAEDGSDCVLLSAVVGGCAKDGSDSFRLHAPLASRRGRGGYPPDCSRSFFKVSC